MRVDELTLTDEPIPRLRDLNKLRECPQGHIYSIAVRCPTCNPSYSIAPLVWREGRAWLIGISLFLLVKWLLGIF